MSMVSPADPPDPVPRAEVRQGVLVGREGGGVLSFKGVPYARARRGVALAGAAAGG